MDDWKKFCKKENWHPVANLFPLMSAAALDSLAENIKKNGLQNPIELFQGKVLDGRNRALACEWAGVQPRFVKWKPEGISPLEYVVTQNLERRHLTVDQRAALAAKLVPRLAEEAQERQKAAGKHGVKGGRGHKKPLAQERAKGLGKSAAQAARLMGGVSTRSVEYAVALEKKKSGTLDRIINREITLKKANRQLHAHPRGSLADRFIVPPFSALDAQQEYYQERLRRWVRVFDPVLCECMYRWFAPKDGGHILDPFAEGSTRGIVAARLGYLYTGVELRPEQVKVNERAALAVQALNPGMPLPKWICGIPGFLDQYLPSGEQYDLIFTSLPHYNTGDRTASDTYKKLIALYDVVFRQAAARLKPNRFLVVKVRELLDEKGFLRDLTGES